MMLNQLLASRESQKHVFRVVDIVTSKFMENLLFTASILPLTTQLSARLDRWLDREHLHHQFLVPQDRFLNPLLLHFIIIVVVIFDRGPVQVRNQKH